MHQNTSTRYPKPTTRPEPDARVTSANVLAALDLELARSGDRGHLARYRRLRRSCLLHDAEYFEAIALERAGLP